MVRPLGCSQAGDITDYGLVHVIAGKLRGFCFLRASDLTDHHHHSGLRIGFESCQVILERTPINRVAPNTYAG